MVRYPRGDRPNTAGDSAPAQMARCHHFSPAGAGQVARLVARGLLAAGVLAEHEVGRLDENVPVDWFAWPEVAALATEQKRR